MTNTNPSLGWAAGAIVSTVDDLADFYRALLRGDLVPRHLVWRMESTVKMDAFDAYGLGLMQSRLPCNYVWGHTGGTPGFNTFAFSSASGTRQVILSLNAYVPTAGAYLPGLLDTAHCGDAARR